MAFEHGCRRYWDQGSVNTLFSTRHLSPVMVGAGIGCQDKMDLHYIVDKLNGERLESSQKMLSVSASKL